MIFNDIQTIECGFTMKHVRDIIITYWHFFLFVFIFAYFYYQLFCPVENAIPPFPFQETVLLTQSSKIKSSGLTVENKGMREV